MTISESWGESPSHILFNLQGSTTVELYGTSRSSRDTGRLLMTLPIGSYSVCMEGSTLVSLTFLEMSLQPSCKKLCFHFHPGQCSQQVERRASGSDGWALLWWCESSCDTQSERCYCTFPVPNCRQQLGTETSSWSTVSSLSFCLTRRPLESGRHVERQHEGLADTAQGDHLQHCGKFRDEAALIGHRRLLRCWSRHPLSCPGHFQA